MGNDDFFREYLRYVTGSGLALLYALDNTEQAQEKITVIEDFTNDTPQKQKAITYKDGCFRVIRKSGLLQYRFMYKGKQCQIYGHTKEECYKKGTITLIKKRSLM